MCSILGAFYVYITNVTFIFAAVIITYLLYLVLQLCLKGSLSQSKTVSCLVEFFCVFTAFALPLFFLWTPFLHNGFGLGGFYCWMKYVDSNCTRYDYEDLIIIYSVSEATSLEMLISSGIVFVVYCRMHTKVKRKHMHTLIQKTCFLVSFHAVAFAVVTIALGVVFYLFKQIFTSNQPLMLSAAIILPIFYEFALIVLFFVSLRTSNSITSVRLLHQELAKT